MSAYGDQLRAAGHTVRDCKYCGNDFPADLDYAGKKHAAQRLYCDHSCRLAAKYQRKVLRTKHKRK